jgi:hypothetical protein
MKTTMITLAAIFTLSANVLFAGNDITYTTPAPIPATYNIGSFAPALPAEANFEDAIETPDFTGLYPVVSSEASFEETVTDNYSLENLSPAIPSEADFE